LTQNQPGALEPIKTFRRGAWLIVQNASHHLGKRWVAGEQDQHPAQMVPVKRFVAHRHFLKNLKGNLARRQLVQPSANKIRLAAYQPEEAAQFVLRR
jgi:hypothetical protein